MKYFILLFYVLFLVSCSDDDEVSGSEFVNPHDQNSVVLNYDGVTLESKDSLQIGASFCCEKDIEVRFELFQDDLRGHLLRLRFSETGEVLDLYSLNIFENPRTVIYTEPFFIIPEEFYEVEYFNFNPEENQLDFGLQAKLMKSNTSLDDNETIDIDTEISVRYFTECGCGPSISAKSHRQLELSPEIKFYSFTESKSATPSGWEYAYSSNNPKGYYFELGNLNSPLEDYDLGVYAFGTNDNEPQLKFKKFIGTPHTLYRQHFDEEWIDYDIEGHFEILEKLEYDLTKLKLTLTASLDGEVVYEFNGVEFAL